MGFKKWVRKGEIVRRPAITVTGGDIYVNKAAWRALGEPTHVSLWFDEERRLVALKAAKPDEEGAYRAYHHPRTGGITVGARTFLKVYGIGRGKYYGRQEGRLLVFWVGGSVEEEAAEKALR